MVWPLLAMAGATLYSGYQASKAAKQASQTQAASAEAGIAEQRRQFDEIRKLLQPYVEAGQPALQAQQALAGILGPEEQQAAIAQLEGSPMFQAMARQGEEAILQGASATGGLRGGNVQAALAQFRPEMLNRAIAQQYERLGGLTTLGQRSAAGVGAEGSATSARIAELMQAQGAAQAGGIMGRANIIGQTIGGLANIGGYAAGQGLFGGTSPQYAIGSPLAPNLPDMGGAQGIKVPGSI